MSLVDRFANWLDWLPETYLCPTCGGEWHMRDEADALGPCPHCGERLPMKDVTPKEKD